MPPIRLTTCVSLSLFRSITGLELHNQTRADPCACAPHVLT